MTIKDVINILNNPNMANKECNFKILYKKKLTLEDVINEMHKGFDRLDAKIDYVEKSINSRIDNLVAKNNLKE